MLRNLALIICIVAANSGCKVKLWNSEGSATKEITAENVTASDINSDSIEDDLIDDDDNFTPQAPDLVLGMQSIVAENKLIVNQNGEVESIPYKSDGNSSALNLNETQWKGYKAFAWPSSSEVINQDYARMKTLMTEYSDLVGTCLHKKPTGKGENQWLCDRKSMYAENYGSIKQGYEKFCQTVVKNLIDNKYTGSQYCQYGNCGEGAQVGLCLALRAQVPANKIYHCTSENDHAFAIMRDLKNPYIEGKKSYCVLDRWDIISKGNFYCDARVNKLSKGLYTFENGKWESHKNAKWYQKVTCKKLSDIQKDGNFH